MMAVYEYESDDTFKYTLEDREEVVLSDNDLKEIIEARIDASSRGWESNSQDFYPFKKFDY